MAYKNEKLPLDVRLKCATEAAPYERPRLGAVDTTINDKREYIVRMPAPLAGLDDWKAQWENLTSEKDEMPRPVLVKTDGKDD